MVKEYYRRRLPECDGNLAHSFSETFTLLPKVAESSLGESCVSISWDRSLSNATVGLSENWRGVEYVPLEWSVKTKVWKLQFMGVFLPAEGGGHFCCFEQLGLDFFGSRSSLLLQVFFCPRWMKLLSTWKLSAWDEQTGVLPAPQTCY